MRDRIESILRGWDRIDGHRTGTRGDTQTADWLANVIRQLGVKPEIDEFRFERLTVDTASILLGEKRIDGLPCFDAPATPVASPVSWSRSVGKGKSD